MRKMTVTLFSAFCAFTFFSAGQLHAQSGQKIANVYQIDKAHKVIVISGKIAEKLATGDKVYVKTDSGVIELVVTFPMMSVAKCRIPPTNDPSDFNKIIVGQDVFTGLSPQKKSRDAVVSADSLKGAWKEFWAPGQKTDVNYNDIYELDLSSATITVRGEQTDISDLKYQNGILSFIQKTSFEVKYTLKPVSAGDVIRLEGSAVTPKGTFPIRWEKLDDGTSNSSSAAVQKAAGSWKEFWAPGQKTDVTYNDEYDITVTPLGNVSVKLKSSDESNISKISFAGGVLSFTQKTAFDVTYSLKLSSDGNTFEGTATTPNKTVPIRWERMGSDPASVSDDISALGGSWKEFWAPGQETDVNYNDIYTLEVSGSALSVVLEKEGNGDNISDISFAGGWLSFTQKTAFDVKYKLKLSPDGSKLEGTATTPSKTVPIRWEKQ